MLSLSVSIEGWFGLTWPDWKQLVSSSEQLGFAGLFLSDHFIFNEPPPQPSLELIVALTYLADHTQHMHFGPMVSPLSVRDPVMLARQTLALDDLSGGRMILAVGAGWYEPEHTMFGYTLGDMATRMIRLEEGLEIITRLLRSEKPTSYEGRFFQLHDALLLPRPQRPNGPPLLIGGSGPRRTLPLVARYADIWNAVSLTPNEFLKRSAHLDQLLQKEGRQPSAVKRTLTIPIICGRSASELEDQTRGLRRYIGFAGMSFEELVKDRAAIMGMPEEVVAQIQAYAEIGVEELLVQWFAADDIKGLEVLATQVLPHLTH